MVTVFLVVLYMCIYVSIGYMCADVHRRQRGVRASGDGVLSVVKHPTRWWEPNSSLLEEQEVERSPLHQQSLS